WFVGLGIDDAVWDASSFSKNRDRLLTTEVAQGFLSARFPRRPPRNALCEERGAFFGGGDDAEGVRLDEELSGQGRLRRAAGRWAQRRVQLPQAEALERNARLDDGSGRAALPQGQWSGEPAGLSGARADGKPQRSC